MSRRAHSNTAAWWAQPDEYLAPPTKESRHDPCGATFAAQTREELALLQDKHDLACRGAAAAAPPRAPRRRRR